MGRFTRHNLIARDKIDISLRSVSWKYNLQHGYYCSIWCEKCASLKPVLKPCDNRSITQCWMIKVVWDIYMTRTTSAYDTTILYGQPCARARIVSAAWHVLSPFCYFSNALQTIKWSLRAVCMEYAIVFFTAVMSPCTRWSSVPYKQRFQTILLAFLSTSNTGTVSAHNIVHLPLKMVRRCV